MLTKFQIQELMNSSSKWIKRSERNVNICLEIFKLLECFGIFFVIAQLVCTTVVELAQ